MYAKLKVWHLQTYNHVNVIRVIGEITGWTLLCSEALGIHSRVCLYPPIEVDSVQLLNSVLEYICHYFERP